MDGLDDITLQRFGSFHFQISSMDIGQNLQIWKTIDCLLNSTCFLATSYPLAWNQSYQLFSSLFCATLLCICFSSASWVLVPLVPGRNMVVSEKWPALMGSGSLDLTHQRILMSCRRDGGRMVAPPKCETLTSRWNHQASWLWGPNFGPKFFGWFDSWMSSLAPEKWLLDTSVTVRIV